MAFLSDKLLLVCEFVLGNGNIFENSEKYFSESELPNISNMEINEREIRQWSLGFAIILNKKHLVQNGICMSNISLSNINPSKSQQKVIKDLFLFLIL